MSERLIHPATKLISFDLWLTLIKSDGKTFKTARNHMLGAAIAPEMEAESFDELVRQTDRAADRLAESRGKDVLFDERIRLVAEAAGKPAPSDEQISGFYRQQTELFSAHPPILLDPETPQLLDKLAGHADLAVTSNTGFIHGEQMRIALGRIGILDKFRVLKFSNEVGYAKPDPAIYRAVQQEAGYQPQQITHIGDNYQADVEGARAAGMHAVHFAGEVTLRSIVQDMELPS